MICIKCNEERGDQFHKRHNSNHANNVCILCHKEYMRQHYRNNIEAYKKKARVNDKISVDRARTFINDYLFCHPCTDCGEKDIDVLEFDHLSDKKIAVSVMVKRAHAQDALEKEIAKCEVVCANCHRRRTRNRAGWQRIKAS